jgi:CheY-like chemotaxis protein
MRLDQVITNLLTNALKYTPDGGRIDITIGTEGDEAVLEVRDSGIGISRQLLPQVFDVFVQGDASLDRAHGGLGLGLALVRRIATLHGGSAAAASDGPGLGSRFTVRLPRIAVPAGQVPAAEKTLSDHGPRTEARRRVLVVDDHDDSRSMLAMMLRLSGYESLEASNGLEGVRVAIEEKPDVAIVDIGLPGINGYEVARRLRANPETRSLPLIALTGYGQDEDRQRALEAGFDLHLVKPVEPDRLEDAIATAGRSPTGC